MTGDSELTLAGCGTPLFANGSCASRVSPYRQGHYIVESDSDVVRFVLYDKEHRFVFPKVSFIKNIVTSEEPFFIDTTQEYQKLKRIIFNLVFEQKLHLNIKIIGQEGIYLNQNGNLIPVMRNTAVDARDIARINYCYRRTQYSFIEFFLNDPGNSAWQYYFDRHAINEYRRLVDIISSCYFTHR